MFLDRLLSLCAKNGTDISNVLRALGLSTSKGTAWRKGSIPNGEILLMLAEYFNTSTDYLLGNTDDPRPTGQKDAPAPDGKRVLNDDDIKFALFGGDGEITDAMFEEVKQFARMVKLREEAEKKRG